MTQKNKDAPQTNQAAASTPKVDVRDGERFRFFLNLPVSHRVRLAELYPTPRALRTALDNAIRQQPDA